MKPDAQAPWEMSKLTGMVLLSLQQSKAKQSPKAVDCSNNSLGVRRSWIKNRVTKIVMFPI